MYSIALFGKLRTRAQYYRLLSALTARVAQSKEVVVCLLVREGDFSDADLDSFIELDCCIEEYPSRDSSKEQKRCRDAEMINDAKDVVFLRSEPDLIAICRVLNTQFVEME